VKGEMKVWGSKLTNPNTLSGNYDRRHISEYTEEKDGLILLLKSNRLLSIPYLLYGQPITKNLFSQVINHFSSQKLI